MFLRPFTEKKLSQVEGEPVPAVMPDASLLLVGPEKVWLVSTLGDVELLEVRKGGYGRMITVVIVSGRANVYQSSIGGDDYYFASNGMRIVVERSSSTANLIPVLTGDIKYQWINDKGQYAYESIPNVTDHIDAKIIGQWGRCMYKQTKSIREINGVQHILTLDGLFRHESGVTTKSREEVLCGHETMLYGDLLVRRDGAFLLFTACGDSYDFRVADHMTNRAQDGIYWHDDKMVYYYNRNYDGGLVFGSAPVRMLQHDWQSVHWLPHSNLYSRVKELGDVFFVDKEGDELAFAYKYVIERVPFFKAMLDAQDSDRKPKRAKGIELIFDVDCETLEMALEFAHTGNIHYSDRGEKEWKDLLDLGDFMCYEDLAYLAGRRLIEMDVKIDVDWSNSRKQIAQKEERLYENACLEHARVTNPEMYRELLRFPR